MKTHFIAFCWVKICYEYNLLSAIFTTTFKSWERNIRACGLENAENWTIFQISPRLTLFFRFTPGELASHADVLRLVKRSSPGTSAETKLGTFLALCLVASRSRLRTLDQEKFNGHQRDLSTIMRHNRGRRLLVVNFPRDLQLIFGEKSAAVVGTRANKGQGMFPWLQQTFVGRKIV